VALYVADLKRCLRWPATIATQTRGDRRSTTARWGHERIRIAEHAKGPPLMNWYPDRHTKTSFSSVTWTRSSPITCVRKGSITLTPECQSNPKSTLF